MQKEAEKFVFSNLLEGKVSICAVIEAKEAGQNDRVIEKILFAKEKVKSKSRDLRYLERKAKQHAFTVELVDLAQIEEMAIGNTHGGILALCSQRSFPALTKSVLEQNPHGFFVFLDGVEDPYNFGYALRSLWAAGVDGILLSPRNWMGAAGVVCRASAGASERFPMYLCDDFVQTAALFHQCGYSILCADTKNAISVYDADLSLPLLAIIGGEKRGICAANLACADQIVRLEYGRDFSCALSAASAATVLAYEILRANRLK